MSATGITSSPDAAARACFEEIVSWLDGTAATNGVIPSPT
jgi:hypothetical protein